MTNEELLEKAKRDYPVGTVYKCASGDYKNTVENQSFRVINNETVHGEHGKGCLYRKGKWAEIISTPKKDEWIPKVGDTVVFLEEKKNKWKKGDKDIISGFHPVPNINREINAILKKHGEVSPNHFRPALPSETPQGKTGYVEYIEGACGQYSVGKIYKVIEYCAQITGDLTVKTLDDSGKENELGVEHFIPSTKEAYEAQERRPRIKIDHEYIKSNFPEELSNKVSQLNKKEDEYSKKTIEVQGPDFTIGRSDQIRGAGLDYSEVKITVGSGHCTNKGRSIEC